eukprot:GHVS01075198.1.p1 GENE.GHVS01075198.1~~GHVS01075198.1.p1  ORF type:complete len:400 (+),score=28.77 GHVS01075198.1:139-1200(+)
MLLSARYFQSGLALFDLKQFASPRMGLCEEGREYLVESPQYLRDHSDELECMLQLGVPPSRPPQGLWYGGVLLNANEPILGQLSEKSWKGKWSFPAQCRDSSRKFTLTVNILDGKLKHPAFTYIGKFKDPIMGPEPPGMREKDFFIVDYTVNFNHLCPFDEASEFNLNLSTLSGPTPWASIVDLGAVVGYTNDGGQIVLGKVLIRDILSFPNTGDITTSWWYVVNFDKDSYPKNLEPGQSIGPTVKAFEYIHAGAFGRNGYYDTILGSQEWKRDPVNTLERFLYFLINRPFKGLPASAGSSAEKIETEWPYGGPLFTGVPRPPLRVDIVPSVTGGSGADAPVVEARKGERLRR